MLEASPGVKAVIRKAYPATLDEIGIFLQKNETDPTGWKSARIEKRKIWSYIINWTKNMTRSEQKIPS